VRPRLDTRTVSAAALVLLLGASALLRTRAIGAGYWIDEGISVGIAGHAFADIPGLLAQDGSPPLYYLLLSLWTSVAGSGETATHALSLIAALATVPAALWAGRALFGTRAGWAAAAIAATLPLLTVHAQETRMYALIALLSLLLSATFVLAFMRGSGRALIAFGVLAVLTAYTHNWGLYLLAGLAAALPLAVRERGARPVLRDAALAGGATALAYAPWIPTLIDQARHTGAPWSTTPDLGGLVNPVSVPLGEGVAAVLVVAVAVAALVRARQSAAAALALALVVAGALAWGLAQVEPGWADRYMTVFAGPVILLAGAGLAAAGRAGMAVLAVAVILWALDPAPESKSNAREVARVLAPGDLVVVTHPEQVPVLRHYAPSAAIRWASALGPVADPRVFDWRDAPARLNEAEPRAVLGRLLDGTGPAGAEAAPRRRAGEGKAGAAPRRLVLIAPARPRTKGPEWIDLVARTAAEWSALVAADPRLARVASAEPEPIRGTSLKLDAYRLRAP
jgi:hypothetical protein